MKKRVSISVVSCLMGLAAILGIAYFTGRLIPNGWAAGSYAVRGVDVSHHQGPIDWPSVASEDIGFAYIKATEGGDFRDDQFVSNSKQAAACGIPCGAYHFFIFNTSGALQADNFIATVPVASSSLPPAVDLEFVGNTGVRPSVSEFRKELAVLLSRLRHAYHREPVLYTTDDFYAHYLSGYPVKRLWIRNTLNKPELPQSVPGCSGSSPIRGGCVESEHRSISMCFLATAPPSRRLRQNNNPKRNAA